MVQEQMSTGSIWRIINHVIPIRANLGAEQLNQFYANLEATFQSIRPKEKDKVEDVELGRRIEEILSRSVHSRNWQDARLAERHLVGLLKGGRLRATLLRRIEEAKLCGMESSEFYSNRIAEDKLNLPDVESAELDQSRRVLLENLTEDLHWFYMERYVKRKYASVAFKRAAIIFMISFLVFVATLWNLTFKDDSEMPLQGNQTWLHSGHFACASVRHSTYSTRGVLDCIGRGSI